MKIHGQILNGLKESRTFRDKNSGSEVLRFSWKGLFQASDDPEILNLTMYLENKDVEVPRSGQVYDIVIKVYERESPFTGSAVVDSFVEAGNAL